MRACATHAHEKMAMDHVKINHAETIHVRMDEERHGHMPDTAHGCEMCNM